MSAVPILVIAYNRPNTLNRQLKRISLLTKTQVLISVDGAMPELHNLRNATLKVADKWATSTHHEVKVVNQSRNLGIYDHLPTTLEAFFSDHSFGAILEDDIEFNPSLFDMFNSYQNEVTSGKYWSICGHNPNSTNDPSNYPLSKTLHVYPSNFHSVWGWATSAINAEKFLENYREEINQQHLNDVLERTAHQFTRDPFLQKAFILTWQKKLSGWTKRRSQSGWDTRWVFEGWSRGDESLLPKHSLSREESNQSEGQTHPHTTLGYECKEQRFSSFTFALKSKNEKLEISLLSIWGIRRPYAWVFSSRIRRQLKEFLT
jgi:hypothetical protein